MQSRSHTSVLYVIGRDDREQNRVANALFRTELRFRLARKEAHMSVTLGSRWRAFWTSGKNLRNGWLAAIGLAALYVGAIRPYDIPRGIDNSRATGLAADNSTVGPLGYWRQARVFHQLGVSRERGALGVVGGLPGGIARGKRGPVQATVFLSAPQSLGQPQDAATEDVDKDRKIVRTSSLELVVAKPAEAAEKIRALAERVGGFLVSSEIRGDQDISGGSLTIRVPAARFEDARSEIRKLGLRVESERIEAQDVTRQYVDQGANLRNLRAEEGQYLAILKQAKTVKDTLEVSEKLSAVRGQIEQQQAEFDALSKQTETVTITVSLRAEAEARVFGLNWRPLYQTKLALRDGLDGVATYVSTMIAIVFFLPTIILWLVTIVIVCAVGWKTLRWVGRRFFGWKPAPVPVQG